ncbi:MAG TPA: hypothetical protein VHC69_31110 [Polyangiaceae bacterium]|nr:hypothetical protein [Polyangiaceae bacterium]
MTAAGLLNVAKMTLSPDAAREYRAFLDGAKDGSFDPYYAEEIRRFEVRDDDVLVGPGDVSVRPAACGSLLESARAGAATTVCGVGVEDARACFAALDGARTAVEARAAARVAAATWRVFLEGAFGKLVFAPLALAELERRASHAEVVRFAGSPYEIVRAYWENMGDVRARVDAARAELDDTARFTALLSELNVLCHVGASGESFYRPASQVVGKEGVSPGEFWRTPSVTEQTSAGVRFVSGPRVGATLIGGERYQALLTRSVDDEGALAEARSVVVDGEPWGRVVTARADGDEQAAPWFCPPRPFGVSHLHAVRRAVSNAFAAARRGDVDGAVREAAGAHFRLIRLHPFMSGNQSVAMGLVNGALRAAFGAGMSHLVLDHLALRLSLPAYERVFARAVAAWLVRDESPVRRALELASRRRRLFTFLEELRNAPEAAVPRLVETRGSDAELALLSASV